MFFSVRAGVTPYFPNLNPRDYDLVPKMQPVHGKLFLNKEDVLTAVRQAVTQICLVIPMMFAVVSTIGNELSTTSDITMKVRSLCK
jgi:hypothetical protein